MRKPYCTPPNTPRIGGVPVCRPATPFGGAASGLWPSGGAIASPSPTPAPAPPPGPTCTTASVFADCFALCSGTIPPGSVCGWSFSEDFGAFGGNVSFTPGMMSLNSAAATEFPAAVKISSQPIGVTDMTIQYQFSEFPTVPLASGATYAFYLTDPTLANAVILALDDSGTLSVQAGAAAGTQQYLGTWTPNNGSHTLHLTVDAIGVPTLYIDGVLTPLVPGGMPPLLLGTLPANSVSVFAFANVAGTHSAVVSKIAVTTGQLAMSTDFCCPT